MKPYKACRTSYQNTFWIHTNDFTPKTIKGIVNLFRFAELIKQPNYMSESQKPVSSSDEIDLGVLFSKIGNFFTDIGLGIMRFLALIRRVPLEHKTLFIFFLS